MSYRDTSNYEPFGTMNSGRPLRPFNWVQWAGVGFGLFGLLIAAWHFAVELGWLDRLLQVGIAPAIFNLGLGAILINSRREGSTDPAPELAAARKRWLLITLAICAAVLGAAAFFEFKGA